MGQKASAITNKLPDPNDMLPAGNDVHVVVSRRNTEGTNSLYAPVARVNAYVSNPNSNLIIEHAGSCGGGQPDATGVTTRFQVFRGNSNETVGGLFFSKDQAPICQDIVIWLGDKGLVQSTVTGHAGYYMVAIDATHLGLDGQGKINAFKVRVDDPAGIVGYTARSDAKFALQDRFGLQDKNDTTSMRLPFAPSCDLLLGQTQNVDLRWFDDDWGANPQLSNAAFTTRLYEYRVSDGALTSVIEIQPRGGDQSPGDPDQVRTITVRGGYRYIWSWDGVSKTNGIQFKLPFDSFNYSTAVNCRVSVQTNTFKVDAAGNNLGPVTGVRIETCNATGNATQQQDAPFPGFTRFDVPAGSGFCARVNTINGGPPSIPGFDGPFIRPWSEAYGATGVPACPGRGGPPYSGHCGPASTYEYQVAGRYDNWRVVSPGVSVYDRASDGGYDFVYVKSSSNLDGVKIDSAGVRPGGTNTAWGGNCVSVPAGNPACDFDGDGSDSLAEYPFSDDLVCIDGSAGGPCDGTNYFGSNAGFQAITPGNHTISIVPAGTFNGGWRLKGYAICIQDGSCTSGTVTNSSISTVSSGISSFSYNFEANKNYSMRWIYEKATLSCTLSPLTATPDPPGTGDLIRWRAVLTNTSNVPITGGTVTFTASGGYNNTPSPGYGPIPVSGAPGNPIIVDSSADYTVPSGPITATATVTYTYAGGSDTASCPDSFTPITYTRPYFRIYGGDILAGSGLPGSCIQKQNAGILAFNKGSAGGGAGSGTQLAAQAVNLIHGFSSAAMRNGLTQPNPVAGLTFANRDGPPLDGLSEYHGSFGYAPCITDYAAQTVGNGYALTAPPAAAYSIPPGFSMGAGDRKVIRIQGDIVIRNNIVYDDNSGSGWTSIADIPSLYVIAVGGNISIEKDVSQLDGVYIALPSAANPTKGVIYTCTEPGVSGSTYPPGVMGDKCDDQQLTVNGAFIAKTIKLLRTRGDYDSANPLIGATANEAANPSKMAEIFNYPPELFLTPSPFISNTSYQSITNLPPVL